MAEERGIEKGLKRKIVDLNKRTTFIDVESGG